MDDCKLEKKYKGEKFTVSHCEGALKTFDDALKSVETRKRRSLIAQMIMQIQRLSDGKPMSKENFPQEGDLPKKQGQQSAKKFNALKRIPLRGYCWLSESQKDTYFISHYVYKDYDKLKEQDSAKVGRNWTRIEVNGDEC